MVFMITMNNRMPNGYRPWKSVMSQLGLLGHHFLYMHVSIFVHLLLVSYSKDIKESPVQQDKTVGWTTWHGGGGHKWCGGHTTCRFLAGRLFYYPPCLDGWFETNWDQLTIGGPQLKLARTTFLTLILISRSLVFKIGVCNRHLCSVSHDADNNFRLNCHISSDPSEPSLRQSTKNTDTWLPPCYPSIHWYSKI